MADERWYCCDKCKKCAQTRPNQLTAGGIRCDCGNIIPYGITGESQ